MKIWVAGAAGMLGTHLTKHLAAKNIDYSDHLLDITDRESVEEFVVRERISHIINCAAYTQVDKAETDSDNAFRVNALGPENLGIVSKKYHLPIVHFSTDYLFDGSSKTPYTEDAIPNPLNVYGATKWEGEKRLNTPYACIIRTSWLFGNGRNFVQTMIRLMQERETLSIVSDQIGRPTYAGDLAIVALKMLGQTGIYHFANSGETSWYLFAKKIYEECLSLGFTFSLKEMKPIPSSSYPTPAKRPAYSTLSTAKIERLQICPRPWKEALLEYLHNYFMLTLAKIP